MTRFLKALTTFGIALLGILGVHGTSQAIPFDGSSPANAGRSAAQILQDGYSLGNGTYWIDPDGAGGNSPFMIYADMSTAGGGWNLVRHVAGTGEWFPANDNLQGTASLNSTLTDPLSAVSWTIPFATLGIVADELLFMTGDGTAWGVISMASATATNSDLFALNAQVIASSGVGVAAGGFTNVLNRVGFPEDPWIGFEVQSRGAHSQDDVRRSQLVVLAAHRLQERSRRHQHLCPRVGRADHRAAERSA